MHPGIYLYHLAFPEVALHIELRILNMVGFNSWHIVTVPKLSCPLYITDKLHKTKLMLQSFCLSLDCTITYPFQCLAGSILVLHCRDKMQEIQLTIGGHHRKWIVLFTLHQITLHLQVHNYQTCLCLPITMPHLAFPFMILSMLKHIGFKRPEPSAYTLMLLHAPSFATINLMLCYTCSCQYA